MANLGNVPYNVRQTFLNGQMNMAHGEAIGRMFRKSDDATPAAPSTSSGPGAPTEPTESGFWLIGLIVLILTALFSVFTGGDAAGNAKTGNPNSGE